MASVDFDHVGKTFPGGVQAVRDFSLHVEDGELLVLVGPSGCGKSTILRLLAGLEDVSTGDIRIGGRSVLRVPARQRNVAMVFQNYALYPHMTVRRNLEFPLRMAGKSRAERQKRVREVADLLDLSPWLERKPATLSGGQRQRVAMGRALVREPHVFLMDEPLSNLDAELRVQLRTEIARLQSRLQVTMLYVTHDQTEAMTLGHRIAVLNAGGLEQVGDGAELYAQPANLFVARFIGSPRINVFRSRLQRSEAGHWFAELADARWMLPRSAGVGAANVNQEILVGVRPEAISLADGGCAGTVLVAVVRSVETLGHERLIYCEPVAAGGADNLPLHRAIIARLPGAAHNPAVGEQVRLCLDVRQFHVFDSNGQALRIF